jgi:hypothetical protein
MLIGLRWNQESICGRTAESHSRSVQDASMFRSANRIEGKIISSDWEKRLTDLEKTVNSTNKLVEQITGFLFKEKKKPTTSKKREG